MMFSVAIVAAVLVYTWVLAPITPRSTAAIVAAVVIGLAVGHAVKTGDWGLKRSAFLPALTWAGALTGVAAIGIFLAGSYLGTWHDRRDVMGNLAVLIPWALGQQFALQTVVLRESQATVSRPRAVWLAAVVFGALHMPNPFLAAATGLGALVWCWIYDRYPNLLPLALSHAILTLAILYAFDDATTGRLRVGYAYLTR